MPPVASLRLGGTGPRRSHGINSAIVVSGRLQEISLHPVHAEAPARLPHPGEGPDPAAAAAALPDLRGGVAEERFSRKRLFSRNHAAVPKNGEPRLPETTFTLQDASSFISKKKNPNRAELDSAPQVPILYVGIQFIG